MPSHPTLPGASIIRTLLERARRRLFGQLALDKGALALLIGMAGAILLLLTGTQILDWYWPVLLVVVSLGAGIYRLRKSLPSFYKLAQQIDRRLGLADTLSTAVHFAAHPEPGREAICESQRLDAERVAQRVDLQQALPPSRSRYLLPAAGLVLVAFGLFAVRYAVIGSLSLEPSLLKIAYDSFFGPPPQQLAKTQAKRLNMAQQPFDPGNPDAQTPAADQQPQDLLDTKDSSDADKATGDDNAKQDADKQGDQNGKDADKQGQDKDNKDGKPGDKGSKDGKEAADNKDKEGGNQDKQGGNPNDGGVLNKIKDALANMLNKMKPNSAQKSQQQNAKNQANEKGEKAEKGDKQQQDSQNQGDEANPDSKQNGDQKQADDAKANNQPGKPSSQQSASGAGSQDGDKKARDAKALEAMGQISEVLGKRSATVSGEVMVEVGSTKQTLKTPFADREATHAEAGGEIHRDEVPLIFQPFVERYFEEIRKTPQAAAKTK